MHGWISDAVIGGIIAAFSFLSWQSDSKEKRRIYFCVILGFVIAEIIL